MFKVGDLVRVKPGAFYPNSHQSNVATVVSLERNFTSPREMRVAPYRDDITVIGYDPSTNRDILIQKVIGVKFWAEPSKEYHIPPKDLEHVT